MRKSAIVGAIVAMFLGSLVLASVADARARGGFSGAGRGSRSYSAPRTPSAPGVPSSPSSPTSPASPTPPRTGGLFGGFGGMIGGFLLGGLLGSLLFGGLGQGMGIGLLDLVLVAGLAYFAFALFRRRQPEPALAGAPGGAAWMPAAEPAAPASPVAGLDQDLDAGIAAIGTMDPGFDPTRMAGSARETFLRVQAAWSARDLGPVRAELTDEMAVALENDLNRLRTLRRTNRVEQVAVEAAAVTEAWQEYGRDFVTVRLAARALDYTLDEATGAVVDGSRTAPTAFEEYWTFTRPVGPHGWRLSAIQQPS